MDSVVGLVLIAAGVFSIVGGVANWDWFMDHRKARFFVKLFTRTGARIFYCILGAAIVVLGVLMLAGVLSG
jgi:predicted small integral membrane protein